MRLLTTMAAVAVAVCLSSVSTANEIYISFADIGSGGDATLSNSIEFDSIGATGSAFVWLAEGQNYTGLFLDALNSDTNVIALTGFEVFNPAITVFGNDTGDTRWEAGSITGNTSGDNPATITDSIIEGYRGFAVQAAGVDNANDGTLFLDGGYEAGNGFQFARIDFITVGNGVANLDARASVNFGNGAAVVGDENGLDGADVTLNPSFSGVSITVNVPEPTSAALLGLGLIGMVSRRRR